VLSCDSTTDLNDAETKDNDTNSSFPSDKNQQNKKINAPSMPPPPPTSSPLPASNIKWKIIQKIMAARKFDASDQKIILDSCQESKSNNTQQ